MRDPASRYCVACESCSACNPTIYLALAVLRVPPVDELALRDLAVAVLVEQLELGLQVSNSALRKKVSAK